MKNNKKYILMWKEQEYYYAMSLYFDLLDRGDTKKEALNQLQEATDLYLSYSLDCIEQGNETVYFVRKAPIKYWLMYYFYRIFKKGWAL